MYNRVARSLGFGGTICVAKGEVKAYGHFFCEAKGEVKAYGLSGCCTGTGDRFSELPDALLLNILERVGTHDAVRACVLSSHLLKLPAMLSKIDIDVCHISRECHDVDRANRAVAELTRKILATRPPQLTIHELTLTFVLGHDHCCLSIGRSVARAMATRKLETVHFRILTEKHSLASTPDDFVFFGKQFNAFFAACQDAFAGLTRLSLQNLRFGESDLPNILGTCNRLEYLRLYDCDAGIGSVLIIQHDRLVELEVICGFCETLELRSLPKLQRITCQYDENPLVFGYLPQLSKISLISPVLTNTTIRLSQLLSTVSSTCDLLLDFQSEKIWVRPESPIVLAPMLRKLRVVNLDNLRERCDITWTMFILEAAPYLKELCITVWDHWCLEVPHQAQTKKKHVKWKPCDDDFKHENLAKLAIFGFEPDNNFMGYVTRVMKAAVRIEEVSLHGRKVCELCVQNGVKVCPSTYPRTREDKYSCIEKIMEGVVMGPPTVIHFRS